MKDTSKSQQRNTESTGKECCPDQGAIPNWRPCSLLKRLHKHERNEHNFVNDRTREHVSHLGCEWRSSFSVFSSCLIRPASGGRRYFQKKQRQRKESANRAKLIHGSIIPGRGRRRSRGLVGGSIEQANGRPLTCSNILTITPLVKRMKRDTVKNGHAFSYGAYAHRNFAILQVSPTRLVVDIRCWSDIEICI